MDPLRMQYFSDAEITDLYETKVKLPDSYFKKYETVPAWPCTKFPMAWNTIDFPRVICVHDFKEWVEKYNLKNVESLGYTFETDPELEFVTPGRSRLMKYPEFDLHTIDRLVDEQFDFFVFNQTLEHLYNPFLAMESLFKIIKPGGYVFTSVPTLNIPHALPFHYNGFTPLGLAMLFKSVGFEVMEIGQWGNYAYIQKLWWSHGWPGFDQLQVDGKVSNERRNVCQCWILARKPL